MYAFLVVTGHSLGAGTAVILAFILRLEYGSLKCVAFGPPGGLLNVTASQLSTDFVTSVVVGDDLVPRLSVNGYLKLLSKMRSTLMACQLPKHKVLATGLCNCLSPLTWRQRLRQDPAVSLAIEDEPLDYGTTEHLNCGNWQEMFPPGKIIHIYKTQTDEQAVSMCFRDPKEFNDILVSAKMINDHAPSSYQKMIYRAKQRFTTTTAVSSELSTNQDINPSV